MKYLSLVLIIVFTFPAFGFDWERCKNSDDFRAAWVSIGFVTSSEFTTSTGECSALAMNDTEEKKKYVTQNVNNLKIDTALGRGQFLAEYLFLNSCKDINNLQGKVKQKYNYIFSDSEPSKIYIRLNSVLRNSNRCLISG